MKAVELTDDEVEQIVVNLKHNLATFRGRKGHYGPDHVHADQNVMGWRSQQYDLAFEGERKTLALLAKFK